MSGIQGGNVRVTDVDEQPQPEQVRRIGRALIELARHQLEAEATAAARPARRHSTATEPNTAAVEGRVP